jgi:hypothetical protein
MYMENHTIHAEMKFLVATRGCRAPPRVNRDREKAGAE